MSTWQDVLIQAYKRLGVYDNGRLTAEQATDGMDEANDLLHAMCGNGIGPRLVEKALTASASVDNGRLYLAGSNTATLTLPGSPKDGDRFGYVLVGTQPLTINPNGRLLEGVTSNTVVSGSGSYKNYFYTSHNGSWAKERDYAKALDFPLAFQCRRAFGDMLAVSLAPVYGQDPAPLVERAKIGFATIVRIYGQGGDYDPPIPM